MNAIERYKKLSEAGRWEEALPVIKEIVGRDSSIATSWFNLAVCLEVLKRFDEAVGAFRKAYELEPRDKGIQYRIFRCLSLKGDVRAFTQFAEQQIREVPEVLGLLREAPEFAPMVNDKWFQFRTRQFERL